MKLLSKITFIAVGLFFILGLVGAIYIQSPLWSGYLMVGTGIGMAFLNHYLGEKTLLSKLRNSPLKVGGKYILYILIAAAIEYVGGNLLNLWSYTVEGLNIYISIIAVSYPFTFLFAYEVYRFINLKFKNIYISFLGAFTLNTFLHEIPNLYIESWQYNMPLALILFGWAGLTALPLVINKIIK